MKAVAAVAVVLVGGYLGATALTGSRIAAAYEARADKLQAQFPFLKVVDRQAEKGMFSSTFSGKLRLGCAAASGEDEKDAKPAPKPLEIGFRDHVRTGPLPGFGSFGAAVIESEIVLPDDAPEALRNYLAGMKPQDIRTLVSYGGDYKTVVRLPGGDVSVPEGKLSWPDVHVSGAGKLDGGAFAFDGHLPELAFAGTGKGSTQGLGFKLANLRWQGTSLPAESIWLRPGSSSMDIERIEVTAAAGGKPVSVQVGKVKYLTEVRADKDLLDAKATITADATVQIGSDAKPIQLDDFEFQESVRKLHGPTLQKVVEASMRPLSSVCNGKVLSKEDTAEFGLEMMESLAQLLPYSPEISVDKLAVTYNGQRGEFSYSASAPGLTAADLESPMGIQAGLKANMLLKANAKLPVAWIQAFGERSGNEAGTQKRVADANMLVDMVVGKGYAVREGDFVTSSAVIEKGMVLVNGKPMGKH